MDKKLQERVTSHVEREHVAKLRIRDGLVQLASSNARTAADELKEMLLDLAADAVTNDDQPRGNVTISGSVVVLLIRFADRNGRCTGRARVHVAGVGGAIRQC